MKDNLPVWAPDRPETSGEFQEAWHLKLNDPSSQRALWIRFAILISRNGFRRVAETWAVQSQRNARREMTFVAVKQTHEIGSFLVTPTDAGPVLRFGDCELGPSGSRGSVTSKGQTISWDLRFSPREDATYDLVTPAMKRVLRVPNSLVTAHSDVAFDGTSRVNDQDFAWTAAPGLQNHHSGSEAGLSWTWGHCNAFANEQGEAVPFVFEGITGKARLLGPMPTPSLSSFHFRYAGKSYFFNSLRDFLHLKSSPTLNEWRFQADRGEISFRGQAKAEHKDFAGLTFEDTQGRLIYDAHSQLSDLTIHVYRRGKLEATLIGQGTLSLDTASRRKNPYVPAAI